MARLPTSLYYFPRRLHVFGTASVVYFVLKSTQLFNRLLRRTPSAASAAWSSAHTRAASVILRTATARQGLWIKCCQYLAARSDAIPVEYARVLATSLDDCPPTPARTVLASVSDALLTTTAGRSFIDQHGRSPNVHDLFDHFHADNPIASASIAQVHKAVDRATGRPVVLKVQHPNIRPILLQDLADLQTLLTFIAGQNPKFDLRPVLQAWINMVPLETDFDHERANQIAVRDALRETPPPFDTTAYVPKPLPQYSSSSLLVMEYIDGARISEIVSSEPFTEKVDRERLIVQITRSFGIQLFLCGVFSGDPHPGNFLVHRLDERGHPVILDFGICVPVSEKLRTGFARLIIAAIHNDSYSLVQALAHIGVNLNYADPVASLDIIKFLFRSTASSSEESMKEQTTFRRNLEERDETIKKNERENPVMDASVASPQASDSHIETVDDKSRTPMDSFPEHLVFFFRSLGMLRGLAVSLNVRHSYLNTLEPFAQRALLDIVPPSDRLSKPVLQPVIATTSRAEKASSLLSSLMTNMYEADMLIGMQVAVYQNEKLALSLAAGRMGRDDPHPVRHSSIFNSFSTTKGLSAILFASIQDDYGVEYDHLVTKYWPEFGQAGKADTTIAHILSHTAGLANTLPEDMSMPRLRDDWQGIISHFERAKPSQPPGLKMEYHALSFGWLVAGLIYKITGRTYQEHLKEFVVKVGIENECFCGTMTEDLLPDVGGSRVASLSSSIYEDLQSGPLARVLQNKKGLGDDLSKKQGYVQQSFESAVDNKGNLQDQTNDALRKLDLPALGAKPPAYMLDLNFYNHPVLRASFIPSANGHFSARALARMYSLVANDGVIEGRRVLAEGRAEKMRKKMVEFSHKGRRAWCAGLTLYDAFTKENVKFTDGAVGHGGIGGSFSFAVPEKQFSMAVTVNKLNAMSVSAAVVIAVVCRAFEVPAPEWYHRFAKKALSSIQETGLEGVSGEHSIVERMIQASDGDDLMKMLVG